MRNAVLLAILLAVFVATVGAFSEANCFKLGDSNNTVLSFQKALSALGYLSKNNATGTFDANTELAVIAFQIDHSIVPSGEVDLETQKEILKAYKPVSNDNNADQEQIEEKGIKDNKPDQALEKNTEPKESKNIKQSQQQTVGNEKEKYISECITIDYKEVERNPNQYKGKKIQISGKVIQVSEGWFNTVTLRVDQGGSQIWYVTYIRADKNEPRILEGDYLNFFGECEGVESYISVLGGKITIPALDAKYHD